MILPFARLLFGSAESKVPHILDMRKPRLALPLACILLVASLHCESRPLWRPCQGRLVGFPYSQFRTNSIASVSGSAIIRNLARSKSAEEKGLYEIFRSNWGGADFQFRKALQAYPESATILSNASAACFQYALEKGQPLSLARALDLADRALQRSSSLKEALFNQALALQALGLTARAQQAWRSYIAVESDPGWLAEAKKRLEEISGPTLDTVWLVDAPKLVSSRKEMAMVVWTNPYHSRRWAEESLLAKWAEAEALGQRVESGQLLLNAERIGEAIEKADGDSMLLDSVRVIRGALKDSNRLKNLLVGHKSYFEGVKAYEEGNMPAAASLFLSTESMLLQAGSPMGYWASFYRAACLYQLYRYEQATALSGRVLDKIKFRNYNVLTGKLLWLRGLVLFIRAQYDSALEVYLEARASFAATREADYVAGIDCLLSELFYVTGESDRAWGQLLSGLHSLPFVTDVKIRQLLLQGAALSIRDGGYPQVALYFLDITVEDARRLQRIPNLVEALRLRAEARIEKGDRQGAESDLREAYDKSRLLPAAFRLGIEGSLSLLRGQLLNRDRLGALKELNHAVDVFRKTNYYLELASALFEKAKLKALDSPGESESVLKEGLDELEIQRLRVSRLERDKFWDSRRLLLDELIASALKAGHKSEAFGHMEAGKARDVLDSMRELPGVGESCMPTMHLSPKTVGRSLLDDEAIIEFHVTDHRVLIWVMQRDVWSLSDWPIEKGRLDELVELFRDAVVNDRKEFAQLGGELYKGLFNRLGFFPNLPRLLIIIPDESLNRVPFGALRTDSAGHFLIQEHEIEYGLSAQTYLCSRFLATKKINNKASPSALLIGVSSVNKRLYPDLSDLGLAKAELNDLLPLYAKTKVLVDAEATPGAVFREAGKYDVVHFAAHALVSSRFPLLSRILLSPSSGGGLDSGALYAFDLFGRKLGGTQLVYLSACSGSGGAISASEGTLSLARPFLAIGVPMVVASQWGIRDDTARLVSLRFHKEFVAGRRPSAALRAAQLSIAQVDKFKMPSSWAGFQIIGAER